MPASARAEAPSSRPAALRRLTQVIVSETAVEARSTWEALLAEAPASAYQTPEWLLPWLATLGRASAPLFVLGFDAIGPVAFLALGRSRRCGVTLAQFLGGPDSNFGLGLFHPDAAWDETAVRLLLAEAGRLGHIDLFWLANQPFVFADRDNPLVRLPHRPSPSLQHEAALAGADDGLAQRLSAKARKHIRQKEAKLAALGPVRHVVAQDATMADRIATALLGQRAARFGPTTRDPALHGFLRAAGAPLPGSRPGLALHALFCGDTIVSAFAGASHAGRVSGMMVSFASDPAWARFSPGELLIARIMTEAARDGASRFDLGIGEARYKEGFCPVAMPLFDTVVGTTSRGRLAARVLLAGLRLKRRIKQDPRLWRILDGWRSRMRRVSRRRFALRP